MEFAFSVSVILSERISIFSGGKKLSRIVGKENEHMLQKMVDKFGAASAKVQFYNFFFYISFQLMI